MGRRGKPACPPFYRKRRGPGTRTEPDILHMAGSPCLAESTKSKNFGKSCEKAALFRIYKMRVRPSRYAKRKAAAFLQRRICLVIAAAARILAIRVLRRLNPGTSRVNFRKGPGGTKAPGDCRKTRKAHRLTAAYSANVPPHKSESPIRASGSMHA